MDEVVNTALLILQGVDKISPAAATSEAALKRLLGSGADVQRDFIRIAKEHEETIKALNQIYEDNQRKAKAGGRAIESGANQAAQSLNFVGKQAQALQQQLGRAFGVIAIEEFVRESYTAFANQEQQMKRLQLVIGGTKQNARELRDTIADIAGVTGRSWKETATAFQEFMVRSGLRDQEAEKAFKGIAEAANMAGVKMQDMSHVVTTAMTNLKISAHDLPQLLGALGKAFANLGADAVHAMPPMIALMERQGMHGKEPLEQMTAALAVLKKEAGPGFQQAMQTIEEQMADPDSKMARWAKAGGLTQDVAEGRKGPIDQLLFYVEKYREIMSRNEDNHTAQLREADALLGKDINLQNTLKNLLPINQRELRRILELEYEHVKATRDINHEYDGFLSESAKALAQLQVEWGQLKTALGGLLGELGGTNLISNTVKELMWIKQHMDMMDKYVDKDPETGEATGGAGSAARNWLKEKAEELLGLPKGRLSQRTAPGTPLGPSKKLQPMWPLWAEGGIAAEPTLAMVGESGPEAVVPLSSGADMRGAQGGTQSERDAAQLWGRLHGLATAPHKRAPIAQSDDWWLERIKAGGGGSAGGGGAGSITGGGGLSGGAGASGTTGTGTPSDDGTPTKTGPSQVTAGGGKGRWPNIGNIKAATKDQLMKEGLTEAQAELGASGLVGQAIAESGLRSQFHDAGRKPGGEARGYVRSIYGADHARGQRMIAWLKANNLDPNDTAAQGRWMAHEVMKGGYGRSVKAMRGGDLNTIADALTQEYEAPASRFSAGTLRERRNNAATARGVETVTKMAKGAVVRKPTLAMVGEKGPEAVVPLTPDTSPLIPGGDADTPTYQASSPEQFDLHDLARRNEQVLRPGIKRARPSFTDVLRQNPQLGIPEGQAGGPGGTNLFGGSEFKELKAVERNLERPDEKQLKYGQDLEQGGLGYYERRGGWRKDLGGFDAAYGGSSGGAGASGSYPAFGAGYGGGQTPATEGYTPSVANIPPNAHGFINAIGRTETDFSDKEAYSDATNRMSYGGNTSQYDYGYYQMAQRDIDYAVKSLHMSPDIAQHLTGGPDHKSSYDQQTAAVDEYLKRRYPDAYKNLVEHDDYEGMRQATRHGNSWTWFGLKDKPKQALTEYNKTAHPQTTAVTPLPKSRPAPAQASVPPVNVPVAPAKLGAHRQSFGRSVAWAQRQTEARRVRHEATVHTGAL